MTDNQLALPVELLVGIFTEVAGDLNEAANLCRVSTWVQDVVEPILYRVLALKSTSKREMQRHMEDPKVRKHLRALGIVHAPINAITSPLFPLRNIRNFATNGFYNMDLINSSRLEEFHLLTNGPLGQGGLPKLKKFHISGYRVNQLLVSHSFPIDGILRHINLTHIAFSVPEDPNLPGIFPAINRLLKGHKSLSILLVRLLRSTSLVLRGTGAAEYESAERRLASIGDPRLFVERVDVSTEPEELLNEWESNARSGRSIWDRAESQLAERIWVRRDL